MNRGLILLDRDGVLNEVVIDPEHGTIDSPLHPDQVKVRPEVPRALSELTRLGYGLAIVTNQPSAAKGKTTLANLKAVHEKIVSLVESQGAKILSSHICFHRSEDGCACRKPKPGLLLEAFERNPTYDRAQAWMVGDGVTDVEAGKALGLKTGFLGPKKCDSCKVFENRALEPEFWGKSLEEFVQHLKGK